MGFGKKKVLEVKPVEEKKGKKESAPVEIKLAEPIQRILREKEAEIKELEEKLRRQETKAEDLKVTLDALTAEKEKLAAELGEEKAVANDLKSKFKKSEEKLAEVEAKLRKAKEAGGMAEVPLEELVYVYILGARGEIAVPHCAQALGVEEKQVKKAIDRLVKNRRIAR